MSNPLDITAEQAREIVLAVSEANGWVPPELRESQLPQTMRAVEIIRRTRESYGDVIETISRDIYSRRSRFILELIQNAEDCQYSHTQRFPSISFDVNPERIIVEYNEDGFVENDVRQICHTGKSWKRLRPGYVGEKGIGFKSVFQIASKVHIQSNAFSFSFEYKGGITSEDKLGIVTPIPENEVIPSNQRPLTRMTLTLNNSIPYTELVSHFTDIPESLLLFLSKLEEIRIAIQFPGQDRIVSTTFRKSHEADGITRLSKLADTRNSPTERRYHITKTLVSGLPNDDARLDINECEVVLAFPIEGDGRPRISTQIDVFAFLPVCTVGFNFLIQADFILASSREEVVVDSAWNNAIIEHIAEAFCNTIVKFCGSNLLRFCWMRYLPLGRQSSVNPLWKKLSSNVISLLAQERILYPHDPSHLYLEGLKQPQELRTLPRECLDGKGSPLFADKRGRNTKYLSLSYKPEDVEVLRTAFHIRDIEDTHICHRIEQDLNSPTSTMKASATDADWHSRAADLMTSILVRNPAVRLMMKDRLDLIPLSDGRWVKALTVPLFFPAPDEGPEIPQDLMVTIQPTSAGNPSRRKLFTCLGAIDCPPDRVLQKLWASYLQHDGASNLAASKAHLRYLFWHFADHSDARFTRLWLYDSNLRKVTSRQKIIYFPSDDEFGPKELLKAVPAYGNSGRIVPECPVPYINTDYMDLFHVYTWRHSKCWPDWLETVLGVRRIPRLKHPAGSLSSEMRHILRYRPEKIVGTLRRYWTTYRREMTDGIEEEISGAEVTCQDGPTAVLSGTYFPIPSLKQKSQELGIARGFPFLDVPGLSVEDRGFEEWRFLERFGVKFEATIDFYLEILGHHEAQRHQSWNGQTRSAILKAYEIIADHCSELNRVIVKDAFIRDNLILHPRAFHSTSTEATWLDAQDCLWRGPENLLDQTPLASVASYRNNRKLKNFFCDILGIRNANWHDYVDMLLKFKRSGTFVPELQQKVLELYKLLFVGTIRDEDWSSIKNTFLCEGLIYDPAGSAWFSPSQCLWTSPVPIEGKAIIGSSYPDDLRPFFLERMGISLASLTTLVAGLCSLAQGEPSLANIEQMIWAINAMDPKKDDLKTLVNCNILPVRYDSADISFQNCRSNFFIIDRVKLEDIFKGHVGFLAFSLEEVRQLDPFLQALDLSYKFLSQVCIEETACSEDGVVDKNLTEQLRDRAYDLLRCAVSDRSPLVHGDHMPLYTRLLASSILKAEGISTQYSIQQENGHVIRPTAHDTGFVHIQEEDNTWQIFVPINRRNREICYRRELPDVLTKLFKIAPSARENISNILNASISVIDNLLEQAGIARVPGLEPPSRRVVEDEQEILFDDDNVALRNPRESIEIETVVSQTSHLSLAASGVTGISTRVSERTDTPSSSILREASVRASIPSFNLPPRSPSPEIPGGNQFLADNAYLELLENVVRIASQEALPHRDVSPGRGNGDFHQGFDHVAAFGVRSQGQMNHDVKIGAAGELFVYECLLNLALPSFDWGNWRSTIRKEIRIHPNYRLMPPWPHRRETSDIVYDDVGGVLTQFLVDAGYLDQGTWEGAKPEYSIEVKTTTGDCGDRFFVSSNQYSMMQDMALVEGRVSRKIYVICRVYNLGRENLNMKIYVDPEAHRGSSLAFETHTWTVKPIQ